MPPLIGHAAIVRELQAFAASDDPPHAVLFAGPDGTGRTALAIEYALLLNCERLHPPATAGASLFGDEALAALGPASGGEPCGECRACRLIAEGSHPDIIRLGPGDTLCRPRDGESHPAHADSRDIRICQVRGMIDLASRFPFEARYRFIIIDPADGFAHYAQYTVLKTLEEPPGHTVFCLVTAAPEALLETIVSRCRRIDVRPVARAEIEAGLRARGVEPGLAARAAEASHGLPGRAIQFAEQPHMMGERERLLERCGRIAAEGIQERFKYAAELAERYRKDRIATLVEMDAWEAFWEERLREGASAGEGAATLAGFLEALSTIRQVREDLLANVLLRILFESMLLSFPRVTLTISPEEEPVAHA